MFFSSIALRRHHASLNKHRSSLKAPPCSSLKPPLPSTCTTSPQLHYWSISAFVWIIGLYFHYFVWEIKSFCFGLESVYRPKSGILTRYGRNSSGERGSATAPMKEYTAGNHYTQSRSTLGCRLACMETWTMWVDV